MYIALAIFFPFVVLFLNALNTYAEFRNSLIATQKLDNSAASTAEKICDSLKTIAELNQPIHAERLLCPEYLGSTFLASTIPAKKAYLMVLTQLQQTQIAKIQSYRLNREIIEFDFQSPFRDPPDLCGFPGQLKWLHTNILTTQFKSVNYPLPSESPLTITGGFKIRSKRNPLHVDFEWNFYTRGRFAGLRSHNVY